MQDLVDELNDAGMDKRKYHDFSLSVQAKFTPVIAKGVEGDPIQH